MNNWKKLAIGSAAALTVVAGLAITAVAVRPQSASAAALFNGRGGDWGRGHDMGRGSMDRGTMAHGADRDNDQSQLAEALGITVDELETAQETAVNVGIDQALEAGLITEAQATRLRERSAAMGFAYRGVGRSVHRMGQAGDEADMIDPQALLADALGITVDELEAAQQEARDAALDQALADGRVTEEQVALMQARQALADYIDQHELTAQALGITADELAAAREAGTSMQDLLDEQGLEPADFRTALDEAHAAAIELAVADGVITQEQADALEEQSSGRRGGFSGGHGTSRGERPDRQNNDDGSNDTPASSNGGRRG